MNRLEDFLRPSQKELFSKLCRIYKGHTVVCRDEYILVRGEAPILLLAHLDTVHKERVSQICKTENGTILMSPQGIGGDDRCGVYALVTAHRQVEKKPWLLFTCNEEIGGVGAGQFARDFEDKKLPAELADMKLLVEIDRKGSKDAVYYECENEDFETYITSKGFITDYGSYSDICDVAPALGVAAVNLSSGYYNAHTLHEYINRKHLNATVQKVVEIIADAAKPDFPKYEYIEAEWPGLYGGSAVCGYGGGYGGYGGYGGHRYWDTYWTGSKSSEKKSGKTKTKKKSKKATGKSLQTGKGEITVDIPEQAEDGDTVPANLPTALVDLYVALLDWYTVKELEDLRAEYGDGIIAALYESECESDHMTDYRLEGEYEDYTQEELEELEADVPPVPLALAKRTA